MTKFETEMRDALITLATAIEKIELVCEDLIDCNDDRLMDARHALRDISTILDKYRYDNGA